MSRLRREGVVVVEGGGFNAIIVLLVKQMHLQKDVAVDFAPMEEGRRDMTRTRNGRRCMKTAIVVD